MPGGQDGTCKPIVAQTLVHLNLVLFTGLVRFEYFFLAPVPRKLTLKKTLCLSAALFSGWTVAVDNTTSTSILIQWANLTSLLNRQVLHYIILLNTTNVNAMAYEVKDGSRLSAEIDGLVHSTNYAVTVFGVDERGRPYKTIEVNATTRNSKNVYVILTLISYFHIFQASSGYQFYFQNRENHMMR